MIAVLDYEIGNLKSTNSWREYKTLLCTRGLKLKPQVIHCHDTPVLPLGVMLKLFTKSKLIYDAHELESERNGLTKILSKMTRLAEKIEKAYKERKFNKSFDIDLYGRGKASKIIIEELWHC